MKSKRFILTVGDDLHQKIIEQAEKLGISASDFVRMSVNERLLRDEK